MLTHSLVGRAVALATSEQLPGGEGTALKLSLVRCLRDNSCRLAQVGAASPADGQGAEPC